MNIFTIYLAGVLSFFSPCVLPIIPVYFYAMLDENNYSRKRMLLRGSLFCLGFIMIFVIMGLGAGSLSSMIVKYKALINLIAAMIIFILALDFLGFITIPILQKTYIPRYSKIKTTLPLLNAFLLGLIFAITWSPCIGAILGGILTYVSAVSGSATKGAYYLFIYGLGVSTPLLLASLSFEKLKGFSSRNVFFIKAVKKILGLVLIAFSLTLFNQVLKLADTENKKELQIASTILIPDKLPVFLTLTEDGCKSCKHDHLIIEQLKTSCGNKTIEFREVNISNPNYAYIALELGILGTPTHIIIDKDGQELIRYSGEQDIETLNEAIKKVTKKSCI